MGCCASVAAKEPSSSQQMPEINPDSFELQYAVSSPLSFTAQRRMRQWNSAPNLTHSRVQNTDQFNRATTRNSSSTLSIRFFVPFTKRSKQFQAKFPSPPTFKEYSRVYNTGSRSCKPAHALFSNEISAPPPGYDIYRWIVTNMVHFYFSCRELDSYIKPFCTRRTCPTMTAGGGFEYRWKTSAGRVSVPAPEYMEKLYGWIELLLEKQDIGQNHISEVYRRLFRVFAHLYASHLTDLSFTKLTPPLSVRFLHFTSLAIEFKMLSTRDILPLKDLIIETIPYSVSKLVSQPHNSA